MNNKKSFHLKKRIDCDLHIAQSYPISMECQSERTILALLAILRLTLSTLLCIFHLNELKTILYPC